MTTTEVYQKYRIPPNLADHQYGVTAVGLYVYDHWRGEPIDRGLITVGLLLHDMGNIIKFTKPFLSEELRNNSEYWEKVQIEFIEEYGSDVHTATLRIINELGLPQVASLINDMRDVWMDPKPNVSWEARICEFADNCVTPKGITTFEDRIDDLKNRYHFTEESPQLIVVRENGRLVEKNVSADLSKLPEIDFSKEIENSNIIQSVLSLFPDL